MSNDAIPFIGREVELATIDAFISQVGMRNVLCIDGVGGIGKTRLLQEIVLRYNAIPGITTTDILDFDLLQLDIEGKFEIELTRALGEIHFQDYLRSLQDLHQLRRARVSFERLEEEGRVIKHNFQGCFRRLADQKRILILLDTIDIVQDDSFWSDILDLVIMARNTLWVFAGRETKKIFGPLEAILGAEHARLVELQEFKPSESKAYIAAKERMMNLHLPPELTDKLIRVASGRPIIVDMAFDWLARGVSLDWLTRSPATTLDTLSDVEQQKLEAALVKPIEQLPSKLDDVILHMAYIYPMDRDIIQFLFGIAPGDQSFYDDLSRLVFVKRLPNNSYTLHDEMRRIVNKHLWEDMDSRFVRREKASRDMASYYGRRADEMRRLMPAGATNATSFFERSLAQQQYWELRISQLAHLTAVDPQQSYELFIRLFEQATNDYQFGLREALLRHIGVVEGKLDLDQLYDVRICRVRYLLDSGRQSDVRKATELLESMLSQYQHQSQRKLDLLTRLGNSAIKSGQIPQATAYFEQALEIARRENRQWVATILSNLGRTYRLQDRISDAISVYEAALEVATDERTLASLYNHLGFVEGLRGEYEAAISYCKQASDIRERLGLRRELAISYATIGDVYRYWGNYPEAITYFNRSLEIFEEWDRDWLAKVYARRGAVRRILAETPEDFADAIADLEKAIAQDVATETPYANHVLGCVYWNQGALDRALDLFAKSDELAAQISDTRTLINNLVGRAEVDLAKWEKNHNPKLRSEILASAATLTRFWNEGYQFAHHNGRMQRVLADLAYDEQRYDEALDLYANAYLLLGGRTGGYGKRTFYEELQDLAKRIDCLPVDLAFDWCNKLEARWSAPDIEIRARSKLLTMCRIQRNNTRMRSTK